MTTLVLLLLLSHHGSAIGSAAWLGYCVGDAFYALTAAGPRPGLLAMLAAGALAEVLLAFLLIGVPFTTHGLARSVAQWGWRGPVVAPQRGARLRLSLALHATFALLLTYLWAQMTPLLLQAVYRWQGLDATTHSLVPAMQSRGWILAIVAAYLAAQRTLLESVADGKPALQAIRSKLRDALAGQQTIPPPWYASVLFRAVLLTFVMSPLLSGPAEAVPLCGAFAIVFLLRETALRRLDLPSRIRLHLPVAAHVLLAVAILYGFWLRVPKSFWTDGNTFRSALIATWVSLGVFAILMPYPRRPARRAGSGTVGR